MAQRVQEGRGAARDHLAGATEIRVDLEEGVECRMRSLTARLFLTISDVPFVEVKAPPTIAAGERDHLDAFTLPHGNA